MVFLNRVKTYFFDNMFILFENSSEKYKNLREILMLIQCITKNQSIVFKKIEKIQISSNFYNLKLIPL
jgi:hypothetical protein